MENSVIITPGIVKLIGFADGSRSWRRASKRFSSQALRTGFFDEVKIYDLQLLEKLDATFYNKHSQFIESSTKGFGYWIWKPKIVLEELLSLESDSDILVYVDVGCTFNDSVTVARQRFADYIAFASESGGLAFELDGLKVNSWTKMKTYRRIMHSDDSLLQSNQLLATVFFLRKSPDMIALVRRWLDYCETDNYSLLDDSESEFRESAIFRAHRHDQAIWSLLARQSGITVLPDETYFAPEWRKDGFSFPIWATRNSTNVTWVSESFPARILRRISKSL